MRGDSDAEFGEQTLLTESVLGDGQRARRWQHRNAVLDKARQRCGGHVLKLVRDYVGPRAHLIQPRWVVVGSNNMVGHATRPGLGRWIEHRD